MVSELVSRGDPLKAISKWENLINSDLFFQWWINYSKQIPTSGWLYINLWCPKGVSPQVHFFPPKWSQGSIRCACLPLQTIRPSSRTPAHRQGSWGGGRRGGVGTGTLCFPGADGGHVSDSSILSAPTSTSLHTSYPRPKSHVSLVATPPLRSRKSQNTRPSHAEPGGSQSSKHLETSDSHWVPEDLCAVNSHLHPHGMWSCRQGLEVCAPGSQLLPRHHPSSPRFPISWTDTSCPLPMAQTWVCVFWSATGCPYISSW